MIVELNNNDNGCIYKIFYNQTDHIIAIALNNNDKIRIDKFKITVSSEFYNSKISFIDGLLPQFVNNDFKFIVNLFK